MPILVVSHIRAALAETEYADPAEMTEAEWFRPPLSYLAASVAWGRIASRCSLSANCALSTVAAGADHPQAEKSHGRIVGQPGRSASESAGGLLIYFRLFLDSRMGGSLVREAFALGPRKAGADSLLNHGALELANTPIICRWHEVSLKGRGHQGSPASHEVSTRQSRLG
jgi:hypothetical protein